MLHKRLTGLAMQQHKFRTARPATVCWFHYQIVGMDEDTLPDRDWFCEDCAKQLPDNCIQENTMITFQVSKSNIKEKEEMVKEKEEMVKEREESGNITDLYLITMNKSYGTVCLGCFYGIGGIKC